MEVVLITGTRKGIGKELAKHFLEKGHQVIGCSRGEASIEEPNYTHYSLDISDEKAVIRMVKEARRTFGRIDILINNAGIASMNHAILTPGKTARRIFDVNVMGSFFLCREVGKSMIKQKYGRIVNFSTVAAPLRLAGEALYASSKAAVESLTRILAHEFGEFGITCNAIAPTPIKTDLIRSVPEEKLQQLIDRQAIKRYGTVDDVWNVIEFFTRPESSFITGQVLYLGGIS